MDDRRRILKALAAAGLLGPAGISGLIRDALAKGEVPIKSGLQKVRGEVIVNHRPASEGQIINWGDTVVTGRNSEAIYVIGQDAFLQRELTTVSYGTDALKNLMRVVSGKLLSVFGRGSKNIQTATATIGIRGTGCYIEAEEARTYFCLCYGEAEVTPTADPKQKETIRTEHHDHPIYINSSGDKIMAPATVINHTDQELQMLENSVGRWPAFYGKGGYKY